MVQELLAQGHETQYTFGCRSIWSGKWLDHSQLDVYDRETFERLLDELHCRVWPDARTRPARLTAFDGECY